MSDRYLKVKLASILGIVGNLFLLIIKVVVALFTNSQAMLADALNSFSDIFSSAMAFVGNKIASVPKDDDHNFGHGKAEYIYSLLISVVMFILSYNSFKSSLMSLINQDKYMFSIFLVIVCIVTIIVKILLALYTYKLYKKYQNILLKATYKDHKNDCLLTSLTLISILFSYFDIYYIDGIVGILISVWIFISAVKIFKESYDILMDKSIDEVTKRKVFDIIEGHEEILKVIHFNSTPVGYRYQISFTIYVDGNLSTFESHAIADKLEDEIEEKLEEIYLSVIHVNPM